MTFQTDVALFKTCEPNMHFIGHYIFFINLLLWENDTSSSPVLQGGLLTTSPTASVLLIPSRASSSPSVKCLLMWTDTTAQTMTMCPRFVGESVCICVWIITNMMSSDALMHSAGAHVLHGGVERSRARASVSEHGRPSERSSTVYSETHGMMFCSWYREMFCYHKSHEN